jgi:hypothetical protein
VTFTPAAGFTGALRSPTRSRRSSGSASATATITVELDVNIAPVAVNDTATTPFGTAATVFVLLNDSDANPTDILSVSGVSNAVNGTAAVFPVGNQGFAAVFTPAAGSAARERSPTRSRTVEAVRLRPT